MKLEHRRRLGVLHAGAAQLADELRAEREAAEPGPGKGRIRATLNLLTKAESHLAQALARASK